MAKELKLPGNAVIGPRVEKGFGRLLSVQRPVVLAHIRSIRARRPDASPEQVIRILERRYLTAVTTGGAAVGASAAIPAVGVGASLALSGVETAGFLEASALFAQSVTELHGIPVEDPERARALVMTMILGEGGADLLKQFASQAAGRGMSRNAYWGELVTSALPAQLMGPLVDRIQKTFIKHFAARQGASIVGRAIPFGIGAAVGGTGNHLLGRKVIQSSRTAFGPPPVSFPSTLDPIIRAPKAPRAPTAPRDPGSRRLPSIHLPAMPKLPNLPGRTRAQREITSGPVVAERGLAERDVVERDVASSSDD